MWNFCYHRLFPVILITLLSGCRDKLGFYPPDFGKNFAISPTKLKLDRQPVYVFQILVKDTLLFVNSREKDYAVLVFNKNSGKLLARLAPIGKGPGKFRNSVIKMYYQKGSIFFYSRADKLIREYPARYILNNILRYKETSFEIYFNINNIIPFRNKFLLSSQNSSRFFISDVNGRITDTYNIYPDFKNIKDSILIKFICSGRHYFINNENDKFVTSSAIGSIMEIFSLKNYSFTRLFEGRYYAPKIVSEQRDYMYSNPLSVNGFADISGDNKYIYTVFRNKPCFYYEKSSLADYIYVFNWHGKPVKSYKINGGLRLIATDISDKRIYMVSNEKNEDNFITYFSLN
jgi:hypothetical protein